MVLPIFPAPLTFYSLVDNLPAFEAIDALLSDSRFVGGPDERLAIFRLR